MSKKKKFKTVQDIVYGQDFVVVEFLFREIILRKQLLTIEALDMM